MADASYDMKKKLLELKSELLKSAPSKDISGSPEPLTIPDNLQVSDPSEMVSLLREINSNQCKILDVLAEINSKIGGI